MERNQKTLSLPINNSYSISVDVCKKRMKNLRLRVSSSGKVSLSIPYQVSYSYAYDFLARKREWIVGQVSRIQQHAKHDFCLFQNGGQVFMLGKAYPLIVELANKNRVSLNGNEVCILSTNTSPEYVQALFMKWCKRYCELLFSNRLNLIYSQMFNDSNFPKIKIKAMKSMWGNCNFVTRVICLNLYLLKTPMQCVDYVITHELAHLVHPNHSPKFHKYMTSLLPDWKARKKMLRGCSLSF